MMIKMILLIALLVGLIYLMVRSQRLETWWRQRQETRTDQPSRIAQLRERTTEQFQATWQRLRPAQPQRPTPAAFAAWAATAIRIDGETAVWLSTLSPDHLTVLTQFVDEFCTSMGFELNWLFNDQLAENPELAATLTAVVQHYLQACRLTFAVRDDLLTVNNPQHPDASPRPSLTEIRTKMEHSVKTMLRRNGKTAEHTNNKQPVAES